MRKNSGQGRSLAGEGRVKPLGLTNRSNTIKWLSGVRVSPVH